MGVVYRPSSGSSSSRNHNQQNSRMSTAGFVTMFIFVNVIGYFAILTFLGLGTIFTLTLLVAADVVLIVARTRKWSFFVSLIIGSLVGGIVYFIVTFSNAFYYAAFPAQQPITTISQDTPIYRQLNEVQQLSQQDLTTIQSLKNLTTLHPYVWENRLFLFASTPTSAVKQIEIPQPLYTSFFERLKMNLGFEVKIDPSTRLSGKTQAMRDFVESQNIVSQQSSVFVADGSLQNLNYQEIFKDELVFRSSTLNRSLITNNLTSLFKSSPITPKNTYIVNGIPGNPQEFEKLGFHSNDWKVWDGIQQTWQEIINTHGYGEQTGNSSVDVLAALENEANVLVIIAHSDGQNIFFPDGTLLTTLEIENIQKKIQKNNPFVVLFSCETAKTTYNLEAFNQALIRAGAKAVIAPVSEIGARTSSKLLNDIFQYSSENNTPIEALWKAIKRSDIRALENWIGHLKTIPFVDKLLDNAFIG